MGVRIAAATRRLQQPFRKALHTVAALGVDGVEIDARDELRPADITGTAVRAVRKLLEEGNLQVAGAVFPTRRGLLSSDHAEQRLAALREAMTMVSRLGGRTLTTNLGAIPPAEDDRRSQALQILELVAADGQRLGVTPVLSASETPPRETAELLADLHAGVIGVRLDPAELIRHGQSPSEWLETLGPHVASVAATDAAKDFGGSGTIDVELGRGGADFDELLVRLLEQYQYRGWIVVGRSDSPRPAEEMADAAAFIRACSH